MTTPEKLIAALSAGLNDAAELVALTLFLAMLCVWASLVSGAL